MAFPTHRGRVAIVTGAARGIGQAIARQLAERGAAVVAVDLDEPTETVAVIQGAGHQVTGIRADVSDPEQTARVGARVAELHGRCDILVNNAGIFPNQHFDDIDFVQWRRMFAVNLDSQFLMVKAVLPLMKANHWGRIVNVASGSIFMSLTGIAHYAATKMGAIGFARGLANDLAGFGITVNAVAPGLIRTPGVLAGVPDSILEQVAQGQPIKRVGQGDDVAGTVLFLTSDDSAFVTAQTILADGGLNRL